MVFLISFSRCSLPTFRNTNEYDILSLYPVTMLNSHISFSNFKSFLSDPLVFSMDTVCCLWIKTVLVYISVCVCAYVLDVLGSFFLKRLSSTGFWNTCQSDFPPSSLTILLILIFRFVILYLGIISWNFSMLSLNPFFFLFSFSGKSHL